MLVLGPSRAFLRYIAQVLPSLGEEAVVQTTIADIAPKAKVRVEEPMEVRRIKGDARMGDLLRRALEGRRRPLEEDVSLRVRFARATLSAERVNDLVASIVARPGPLQGRTTGLAGPARQRGTAASSARRPVWVPTKSWFEGELTSSQEFAALLDLLWPTVSPAALVRDVLSSRAQFGAIRRRALLGVGVAAAAAIPGGHRVFDRMERRRSRRCSTRPPSSPAAAPASYGHIVVDEAQDLTPMQFRMVARRAPSGSITVLGDLAQATGPWNYSDWEEVRTHLPGPPRSTTTSSRSATGHRAGCSISPRGSCPSRRPASVPRPPYAPAAAIPPCAWWKQASWRRPRWTRPVASSRTTRWWR